MHCPNTGSMKNCQEPGSRIWYSLSSNPKRKYPGTWQIVEVDKSHLVGINTGLANRLVHEAISEKRVAGFCDYKRIRSEVPYGEQRSRIDLLLDAHEDPHTPECFVEVKNVSLGVGGGIGLFPDAVTQRGQKHLQELMAVVERGKRALLFFCVQHTGIEELRPAEEIDPEYSRLLREAAQRGVEIMAMQAEFNTETSGICLSRQIPVQL